MKRTNRILASVIAGIMLMVSITGCGTKECKEEIPVSDFILAEVSPIEKISDEDKPKQYFSEVEKASEELTDEINAEGENILKWLNKKYNLNWIYKDVETYITADKGYLDNWLGQLYDGKIYIYIDAIKEEKEIRFIITHELIHYLCCINTGTPFRWSETEEGLYGETLGESTTEYLNRLYLNEDQDFWRGEWINTSSYYQGVFSIAAMEEVIPEAAKLVLKNDIDELEKKFNQKFFELNGEIDGLNPFRKFLGLMDYNMTAEDEEGDNRSEMVSSQLLQLECIFSMQEDQTKTLRNISGFYEKIWGWKKHDSAIKLLDDLYAESLIS